MRADCRAFNDARTRRDKRQFERHRAATEQKELSAVNAELLKSKADETAAAAELLKRKEDEIIAQTVKVQSLWRGARIRNNQTSKRPEEARSFADAVNSVDVARQLEVNSAQIEHARAQEKTAHEAMEAARQKEHAAHDAVEAAKQKKKELLGRTRSGTVHDSRRQGGGGMFACCTTRAQSIPTNFSS